MKSTPLSSIITALSLGLDFGLAQAQTPAEPHIGAKPGESSSSESSAKATPAQMPLPTDPEE